MGAVTRTVRRPWLTVAVLGATAAVSVMGLVDHTVLHHLERRGGELADGEPWRAVTSLLVHDSWLALIANVVLLGVVGVAVERRHARIEWIVLYLSAGIVGELVGLEWQPHGAGNSVAAFGLAGALVVDALRRRDPALLALGYAVVVLVTLVAGDVGGAAGAVILVVAWVAAGASVAATQRGTRVPTPAAPLLGVGALVVAAVLVGLEDIHGPALLTGVVVASVWAGLTIRVRGGGRTAPSPPRG
jgi:membrane associated rhomboid family serine protease